MKIILARPFNKHSFSCTPPLNLGYLASMLKVRGNHDVLLYDGILNKHSTIKHFCNFLLSTKPRIVGMQAYSMDLQIIKNYLQAAKEIDKRIITVIGGPHPSALPEETMDYFSHNLDFAIIGEGEQSLLSLVAQIEENRDSWDEIPGLVWRSKEGAIFTDQKGFIRDLDKLPWPDWELLNPASYPHTPHGALSKQFPVAPVIVSRGCSMDCNFCATRVISENGTRYRNIDDVVAEIGYLRERFGIKEFMIQDDNFTLKKEVVLGFCHKVRQLRMGWSLPNGIRLDTLDDEIVGVMKESGCYATAVGIESGSQKILDDMNKKTKIETITEKVNILAKHKIRITGQFIIGYPTETREDILKTLEFAKEIPIERAAFAAFVPLAGSKIYLKLKEQRKLDNLDFADMSFYKIAQSFTPHVSKSELDVLLKRAVRSFYLRPLILLKIFQSAGSFSNLRSLLKRFINYIRLNSSQKGDTIIHRP